MLSCKNFKVKTLSDALSDALDNIGNDSHFEHMFHKARFSVQTAFNSCAIISCQLDTGYVIVGTCMIDSEAIDDVVDVCLSQILDKALQLETYKQMSDDYGNCKNCEYFHECCGDEDDEYLDII